MTNIKGWIWLAVHLLTVGANLILEKLEDPLIVKGSYTLQVNLKIKDLLNRGEVLESLANNYNQTCKLLLANIPKTQCDVMTQDLDKMVEALRERENFIRSFFPSRTARGFITWIGAMDSDDRIRVDQNVDTLRKNEEQLKSTIKHQTSTVDAMYKFIDTSMSQIDNRMKQISSHFNELELLVQENLNFTNSVKRITYLESELLDIGFKIQILWENWRDKQNTILQILLNGEQGMSWVVQLIEPSFIFKILDEAENNLQTNTSFPRKRTNGDLLTGILNSVKVIPETQNNQILNLKLEIPLISKQKFHAFKGSVLPFGTGTILSSIILERNVLIKEIERDWGFVIPISEYDKCQRISSHRLCTLNSPEIDTNSNEECLLNLRFRNSSENCKVSILNVTKDTWFATENPNRWTYIAPSEIQINVFHGYNHSFMNIQGSGEVVLTPGMIIISNTTKITYSNEQISERLTMVETHKFNGVNFTIPEGKEEFIPKLKENKSWYSIYDHKKLFDLGIDLEDLKKNEPVLENMKYSPLSSTWTFYGFITGASIMIIALTMIFICCFKGKISLKTKKPSSLRRKEITHPVLSNRYPSDRNAKMEKMHEIFCNPSLEPRGNIILDEVRALPPVPPLPIVQDIEESYIDPTPKVGENIEKVRQVIPLRSTRKSEKKEETRISPLRVRW